MYRDVNSWLYLHETKNKQKKQNKTKKSKKTTTTKKAKQRKQKNQLCLSVLTHIKIVSSVIRIQKPVNWFALQIKWLFSIWTYERNIGLVRVNKKLAFPYISYLWGKIDTKNIWEKRSSSFFRVTDLGNKSMYKIIDLSYGRWFDEQIILMKLLIFEWR